MAKEIDLGYMSIAGGEWEDHDSDESESPLEPNEIIVKKQDITIVYDYPLDGEFPFTYHTDNPKGFTREEISELVMDQYRQIYEEEEEEDDDPGCVPGMLNRATSHGHYGIWGHDIGDLILHTLYQEADGTYSLGIDS
jgi:hypothetical protein